MKTLNKPVCVDDFGFEVYVCQYTGKLVHVPEVLLLGAILPGLSGQYVCSLSAKQSRIESKRAFDECDRNCNTCKHLERIPHQKRSDGLLKGACDSRETTVMHYNKVGRTFYFHPNDFMGMGCWEDRP